MKSEICDFCSSPDITRAYFCIDFEMLVAFNIHQLSEGAWAACDECGKLIDTEGWNLLAHRSVEKFVETFPFVLSPEEKLEFLSQMLHLHQKFREGRDRYYENTRAKAGAPIAPNS